MARLRAAMLTARRARDSLSLEVIRTALAAVDNASAVPAGDQGRQGPDADTPPTATEHFAGAHIGVGATEVPRRDISESEARRIVDNERLDLVDAASALEIVGRMEEAERHRRAAEVLQTLLEG